MSVSKRSGTDTVEEITKKRIEKRNGEKRIMKSAKTNTVNNDDFKIIGKKFVFVINNDENNEKTDKACQAFIKWLATPQNSRKYIDCHGIIAGGWCINLPEVNTLYHIGTMYDALTGGTVDVIYLMFNNKLLNRIVYLDNEITQRGSILLPIDDKIEYVPFALKYTTARKKSTTTKTTEKTDKTTPTKTKTPKTATKTTKTTDKKVVTE